MSKCGKCEVEVKSADSCIKCVECSLLFHVSCIGGSKRLTKEKMKCWKCDSCKGDSASVHSSEDTSEDRRFVDLLHSIKSEIITSLDAKISSTNTLVSALSTQFQDLSRGILEVQEDQRVLHTRCDTLSQENKTLKAEVRTLQQRLNDAEQHSRCANIEIVGLPQTRGEDIYEALRRLAQVLNVPFSRQDISIAHRLRLFSKKHTHPPVVVQLMSRSTKEVWLAAAKKSRGLDSRTIAPSLAPSTIYINEQLTSHNKQLLGMARRLQKQGKLHFALYTNGKVLVKKTDKDEAATRVCSVQDLEELDK